VVPRLRMQEVLIKALSTREVEEKIVQAALEGLPLNEARKKFKYHTLQRSSASDLGS
jgi:hypothetical protein